MCMCTHDPCGLMVPCIDAADPQKRTNQRICERLPATNGKIKKTSSMVRVVSHPSALPAMDAGLLKRRQRAFTFREDLFPLLRSDFTISASTYV